MIPFLNFEEDFLTTEDLLFLAGASGAKGVEDTATGNPVTFQTDLAKPLKSLVSNFLPIQSGTGDPSPTNVRPITGWTGLDVKHFGENVIEINRNTETTVNGLTFTPVKDSNNKTVAIKITGTSNANNTFFNLNYVAGQVAFPVGTYKVSGYTDKVSIRVYALIDGVDKKIYDSTSQTEFTITSSMTQAHMRLQISNSGTVIDETIYPIVVPSNETIETFPVTWSTHGTIYGGNVDLVTGEVWATWKEIVKTWGDFSNKTSLGNNTRGTLSISSYPSKQSSEAVDAKCNIAPRGAGWSTDSIHFYTNEGSCVIFLPNDTDESTEIQVVYPLATPVLITTLTPQQITALIGNNTVWSDGNGDCEVTYLKKG